MIEKCPSSQIEKCEKWQINLVNRLNEVAQRVTGIETLMAERHEQDKHGKACARADAAEMKGVLIKLDDSISAVSMKVEKGAFLAQVGSAVLVVIGGVVGWMINLVMVRGH